MCRKRVNQRPGAQEAAKAHLSDRFCCPRPLNAAVPAKTNKASAEEPALDSTTRGKTLGGNISDIESVSLKNVTNTDSASLHGRTFRKPIARPANAIKKVSTLKKFSVPQAIKSRVVTKTSNSTTKAPGASGTPKMTETERQYYAMYTKDTRKKRKVWHDGIVYLFRTKNVPARYGRKRYAPYLDGF